ncbi:pre-RNA processing PIH1/Nop17-domain-containing protein [Lipomyces oligophaga]|uniref:pre-RNA processing PIH1/Nop17-domain-containing protein n=1 Tax=Lipomyces oligophaga TaxID=45792 RepID=UPI0034CE9E85
MFEELPSLDSILINNNASQIEESIELHPLPAFAIKTFLLESTVFPPRTNRTKVFINVCVDKNVPLSGVPGFTPDDDVPVVVGEERSETDNKGELCFVFDCCLNIQFVNLAKENAESIAVLADHCIRVIEHSAGIKLDPDYKLPKLRYKGLVGKPPVILFHPSSSKIVEEPKSTKRTSNILKSSDLSKKSLIEDITKYQSATGVTMNLKLTALPRSMEFPKYYVKASFSLADTKEDYSKMLEDSSIEIDKKTGKITVVPTDKSILKNSIAIPQDANFEKMKSFYVKDSKSIALFL